MSDRDYVIQIEGQSSNDAKTFEVAGAANISGSRRTSTSSQHSLPSCTSPNYDSGNFSCSNTSEIYVQPVEDSSAEDEVSDYLPELNLSELTDDVKQLQKELREKDQMLLLALADARKMKSELERLAKSERWYKNELRNQKRSRLDILEKLYLNERKFVEESQKLKADCANLYSACSEIERKALSEKDSLIKQLQELQRLFESTKVADASSSSQSIIDQLKFELQKQREVVLEKESLIDVLKKQKQSLLRDLDNLSAQRDSKIQDLEANAFTLEQENRKITKKCVALVEEKRTLEEDIKRHEKLLTCTKSILQQREVDISQLREKQQEQLKELKTRSEEIQVLRSLINELETQNVREDSNKSETQKLLEKYRAEVDKKIAEIEELKSLRRVDIDKISKLQVEILSLENLQESHECTKREVEQLKFQLQAKEFEIGNLRITQANQSNQLAGLQEQLVEYQRLRDNFDKYVNLLQANSEILEAREDEIEQLKLTNADLLRDVEELKDIAEKREELLLEREDVLKEKRREIEELQAKFEEQSRRIQELYVQIEENKQTQEDLSNCQNLLHEANESLIAKEKEISELKEFIACQSRNLLEFDIVTQENSKLSKDLENFRKELEQRSEELEKLRDISTNQATEIRNLEQYRDQVGHLQEVVKDKISEMRNRDMEIETLRLVLKGQKAQIKRFQCKCAENEELREKFEEASNLLRIDKNIFETEAAELEYLRKIAERQALEIYKLTEEKGVRGGISSTTSEGSNDSGLNEKLIEFEKCWGNDEFHGTHDLEMKARRIESMKALLDKKSDKILQLNCETERWMELLKNLSVSKSRSRESSLEYTPKNVSGQLLNRMSSERKKEESTEDNDEQNEQNRVITTASSRSSEEISLDNKNSRDKIKRGNRIELDEIPSDYYNKITTECSSMQILQKTPPLEGSHNPFLQHLWEDHQNQIIIHPPKDFEEISNYTENIKTELTLRKTSLKVPENCDTNTDNDWKVLQRVLESEHRKKVARYEVHMRTLLENMKSYKKKLRAMENQCEKLGATYRVLEERLREAESEKEMMKNSYENEIENLMTAKIKEIQERTKDTHENFFNAQQLEKVNRKYEKSQRIIAVLKQQLEIARKQFFEMEDYKRLSVEFKFNLNNFVDDYTKLLSPLNSYKSSIATDEIYDLISKSNNLVPNFDNLSNSIDALKGDIKKFSTCVGGGFSPARKMSLMDELKAADPSRFS